MRSLLVSNCRGHFPWEGLLVVVSLLTFWSPPTTATIRVVSTFTTEGDDVLLKIQNKPPGIVGIVWYKGMGADHRNILAFYVITPHLHLSGPQYNGENMITNDGSLLLKNVTMKDAGMYTVVAHFPESESEMGFGQLDVYERGKWSELAKLFKRIKACKEGVQDDCIP